MTIKDIAKKSGVSVSTVSRVLNNRPDVNPEVRRHVLEVVERDVYIPSSTARDLVGSQNKAVGVVVRGMGNNFFTEIIKTISQALSSHGFSMMLHEIGGSDDEIRAGATLAREKRLQGLLFLGGRFDYTPEEVSQIRAPYVCCTYSNRFGSLPGGTYASVSIDDVRAAYEATEHLLQLGHRRIAVILPKCREGSICQLRFEGYTTALEKWGIAVDPDLIMETGSFEMEAAYSGMTSLIRRGSRFHRSLCPFGHDRHCRHEGTA